MSIDAGIPSGRIPPPLRLEGSVPVVAIPLLVVVDVSTQLFLLLR